MVSVNNSRVIQEVDEPNTGSTFRQFILSPTPHSTFVPTDANCVRESPTNAVAITDDATPNDDGDAIENHQLQDLL